MASTFVAVESRAGECTLDLSVNTPLENSLPTFDLNSNQAFTQGRSASLCRPLTAERDRLAQMKDLVETAPYLYVNRAELTLFY